MWKLAAVFFIVIGPTLAGIGALIPLTVFGVNAFDPLILAGCAAAGAVVALPVSYMVARRVNELIRPKGPRTV